LDPQLATAIQENLKLQCRSDETIKELVRGIRFHFTNFVKLLGNGKLEQAQLGLGHSYSRTKVRIHLINANIIHSSLRMFTIYLLLNNYETHTLSIIFGSFTLN
jgi:RNA processing factor Prp31